MTIPTGREALNRFILDHVDWAKGEKSQTANTEFGTVEPNKSFKGKKNAEGEGGASFTVGVKQVPEEEFVKSQLAQMRLLNAGSLQGVRGGLVDPAPGITSLIVQKELQKERVCTDRCSCSFSQQMFVTRKRTPRVGGGKDRSAKGDSKETSL